MRHRTGSAHAAFTNPTQAIGNVASYAANFTPPGSVFALFGVNTATKPVSATSVPLPTTLLTTTVTVNGENAPLFYADTGQIDAQMPWDIPGNTVASVIVKNRTSTSNAAAGRSSLRRLPIGAQDTILPHIAWHTGENATFMVCGSGRLSGVEWMFLIGTGQAEGGRESQGAGLVQGQARYLEGAGGD